MDATTITIITEISEEITKVTIGIIMIKEVPVNQDFKDKTTSRNERMKRSDLCWKDRCQQK